MSHSNERTGLTKGAAALDSSDDAHALSPFARNTINSLGYMRALLGAAVLVAPMRVAHLIDIPLTTQTKFVAGLAGIREIAVGELLVTADRKDRERKELKKMLWANIAIDSVDALACGYGLATGAMSRMAAFTFGGGALFFVGLGVAGLRSV